MRLGKFLTERVLYAALEELVQLGLVHTIGEPDGQHAAWWRDRGWSESDWLETRKKFVPRLAVKVALAIDEMVEELRTVHRIAEEEKFLVVADQLAEMIRKWMKCAAAKDPAYCLPTRTKVTPSR